MCILHWIHDSTVYCSVDYYSALRCNSVVVRVDHNSYNIEYIVLERHTLGSIEMKQNYKSL